MLIINQKEIEALVEPAEMVETVERAFVAYGKQECVVPHRYGVEHDGLTALYMPCFAPGAFGTKLLTLVPENRKRGLPSIDGAVVLNDAETGAIQAMLDGKSVTAWRTGAVGALGARLISEEDCDTLGIIGCGVQGLHQAFCMMAVRPIRRICLYSRSGVKAEFMEKLRARAEQMNAGKNRGDGENMSGETQPPVQIRECSTVKELLENSRIVVTATYSETPVLPADPELLRGKCYVAVGSYKPYMRELPDELFSVLDGVYVDLPFACEESGDLSVPIEKGLLREDEVKPVYELLIRGQAEDGTDAEHVPGSNAQSGRPQTVLFKTVGMSVMDLFAANYLYTKAKEKGRGLEVEF